MNSLTAKSNHSWQPILAANTTLYSYWINWRVFLCAISLLGFIITALFLILKYEGLKQSTEIRPKPRGLLYDHEVWRPCFKGIHPACLLGFRVVAFLVLLSLLIANAFVGGGAIFCFYTQWTFISITVYFGLGSLLSAYGCFKYHNRVGGHEIHSEADTEQGTRVDAKSSETSYESMKRSSNSDCDNHPIAGLWGYILQIMFQINAGAVLLTDCVFWFIIYPFLAIKDYSINFWVVNMHTINVICLLGDTSLNSLPFQWFRISYFLLWTSIYVIFQWILHACIWLWWPYPFLDLSSPWAPLWYLSVGLMHIPCYVIFALIVKMKHFLFARWFPQNYQCMR